MKKKINLQEYMASFSPEEVIIALELFVRAGVLIETTKNGERAWKNNPDFDSKTPEQQEVIFEQIAASEELENLKSHDH